MIRELSAKNNSAAVLRRTAESVGLDVPADLRAKTQLQLFLAQNWQHPGLAEAVAALPTSAPRFDPDPVAQAITVDGLSLQDILARLADLRTVTQLRQVANALGTVRWLPAAQPDGSRWTAPALRVRIAEEILRDRTRWSLRSADARRRTLQLLGIEERADVVPGKIGDNTFRNYWVFGKGRRRWNRWTQLRNHLLKYVAPERADRIAAEWFHLRFGFWPGSDLNRVRHGKPPRGKLVGPG